MNNFNEDSGTHLVSVAGLHYEPFGIYAGKTASLDALADGAVVAIQHVHVSGARGAVGGLHRQGLAELQPRVCSKTGWVRGWAGSGRQGPPPGAGAFPGPHR